MKSPYSDKLHELQKLLEASKDKLATVNLFTKKHYPKGYEPDNSFIGTNLKRYIYFDQTKAYLHALRDSFAGVTYSYYWEEYTPKLQEITFKDKQAYEVWTF